MARSPLQRRVAAIERRLVVNASRCDACGGDGPSGLVFAIAPEEPKPPAACPRCGREAKAMLFQIAIATPPAR